ncbi:MAG: glycoside hydrolase family 16 protein [Flavobacterium sp.]|nr:glycoside hydrolase family 16 protein [Flavobacterium sp.]
MAIAAMVVLSCSKGDDSGNGTSENPNQMLINKLTGGSTKKWYWSAAETGHLAKGDNNADATVNYYGNIYQATAFENANDPVSGCLYNNELTFSLQNGEVKFNLNNGGNTFFNAAFLSVGGGSGAIDECLAYTTTGTKNVTIADSNSFVVQNGIAGQTTGKQITFSDGGFMGYYIGQSTYEIMSITDTHMVVRAVMGNDASKAWYHTFTTTAPTLPANDNFTNLIWSDEFDVPGAPNPANWSYNLGNNNGWGNNEAETYTSSSENSIVEGGMLKIIAKKQNLDGFAYTSARLVSENKFDFTYGRAVIRAKLPTGAGTWPAIWMLGKNYPTNAWPGCGEIDIMEHVGNQQNKIFATLHYPGHSGANGSGSTTMINTASTAFHDYSVIWNSDVIKFYVDDQLFYNFTNSPSTPFNLDFFFILNVAMGGNFGGAIDPAFTSAMMEIDYVRVYQ